MTSQLHADQVLLRQSSALYDGNRARGIQTGLGGRMFNGYWFNIGGVPASTGCCSGRATIPGSSAVGLWRADRRCVAQAALTEDGTGGFYLLRLTARRRQHANPSVRNSSISVFYQVGANASETLPMSAVLWRRPHRLRPDRQPRERFDRAWASVHCRSCSPDMFQRQYELMFQAYYQAHIWAPDLSAADCQRTFRRWRVARTLPGALPTTLRLTVLF